MINTKEFNEMRKELEQHDIKREKTIKLSREIIKLSKVIIYAVQRGNIHEAGRKIVKIKELMKKLPKEENETGMASIARQEYVEAVAFHHFIKEKRLISKKELNPSLNISTHEYLMGLCDLTGELMRKAVNHVINNKFNEASKIRDLVDETYHEFLNFNLSNGELRKKTDQIKWNLEKLENIMYDLKIKRK